MKKKLFFVLTLVFGFFILNSYSQLTTLWTKSISVVNGTSSSDDYAEASDMTTDGSGNIYTTGKFFHTVDFDPGVSTFTMTTITDIAIDPNNADVFVCKWDPNGNFIWAKQLGGTGFEGGTGIAADGNGNVYITGYFWSTTDFDPGIGVLNLTPVGLANVFVCKLNFSGDFVWAKSIVGSSSPLTIVESTDITVDPLGSGYVVLTGNFSAQSDFDPGSGIYNMTPTGTWDGFVCKLNTAGNFMWARQVGVGAYTTNLCYSVAVDGSGNVFTASMLDCLGYVGSSSGIVHKYDASGAFLWNTPIGNNCSSVAVDGSGIYATDGSVVKKLNSSGAILWSGQGGAGPAIAVDINGNIIAGDKLDPSGNLVCNGYGGKSTVVDGSLNILTLTMDGLSVIKWRCPTVVSSVSSTSSSFCKGGCATITANPTGGTLPYTYSWNPGGQTIQAITACPTVTTTYTITIKDSYNNISTASTVIMVHPLPSATIISPSSTTICKGQYITLTASGSGSYVWSNGQTTAVIIPSPTNTSTYTVTVTNVFGCTTTVTSLVTVHSLPSAAVSGNTTICQGDMATLIASGGGTYLWNTSATNTAITVVPVITTSYTVTVSNGNCSNSTFATIKVNSLPNATVSASTTICQGDMAMLTASGGETYLWNTSATNTAITVAPAITTSYTVTVSNGNCSNSTTTAITVNPLPNVTISGSTTICQGDMAALTASGGETYLWNIGATTSSIILASITSSTIYSVVVMNGGCSAMASSIINVYSHPALKITSKPAGCLTCPNGSATVLATGNTPFSYQWNPGGQITAIVTDLVPGSYTVCVTDVNGCMTCDTVTISFTTGIKNISINQSIIIFPNPSSGKFTIEREGRQGTRDELWIYNMLGELVFQAILNQTSETVNLGTSGNGVYFVNIKTGNQSFTKKLIIQK